VSVVFRDVSQLIKASLLSLQFPRANDDMAAPRAPGVHAGDRRPLHDLAKNNHSRVQWMGIEMEGKLDAFLTAIPNALGAIEDKKLKMPRSDSDGRKETWEKKLAHIIGELKNRPADAGECWLLECPTSDTSGYPMFKINPKTKYRVHRVLHCIYNPQEHNRVESSDITLHLSHRCGWGKSSSSSRYVCVSPHHVVYHQAGINQDHKGCKYGCAAICPHNGFCLWTWRDTGKQKPCFNLPQLPLACQCVPRCTHIIQPDDNNDEDE